MRGTERLSPGARLGPLRPLLAALVMVSVVVLLDVSVAHSNETFLSLLTVPVALAGSACTVPGTVLVVVVSGAAAVALGVHSDAELWETRVLAVALVGVVSVLGSRWRRTRQRQLVRALSVAQVSQTTILRPPRPQVGSLRVESIYVPAERDALVGGDLFEALDTPFGVRLLIGDVRGKGLTALNAAATVVAAFRVMAFESPDLPALAARLDRNAAAVAEQLSNDVNAERFATALLVEVPADQPVARLVCCGHPPPLLVPAGGRPRLAECVDPAPPLALGRLVAAGAYHLVEVPFAAGDRMLLYTDGIGEARDPGGEFYPLERRFPADIDDLARALAALRADVERHVSGPLGDDAAMLLVRRDGQREGQREDGGRADAETGAWAAGGAAGHQNAASPSGLPKPVGPS